MLQRLFSILVMNILFLASCALSSGAPTAEEIYRILEEQGISFDADVVKKSTIEGILKSADHCAKILAAEDAQKLVQGKTIETFEEWPEGICYLKLGGLYEGAGSEVTNRLQMGAEAGRSGLIVDMRGAGGGDLSSVDEIAGLFVAGNTVLYRVKDTRGGIIETHRTKEDAMLPGSVPLMLVVDEKTCDSSEVLAAVLKGRSGVLLVGTRTHGDDRMREIIPLAGNEVLYIATRQIVLAEAAGYASAGVQPDIVVSAAEDDVSRRSSTETDGSIAMPPEKGGRGRPLSDKAKLDRELMVRVAGDAALVRAADILLGLKALSFHGTEATTNTAGSARQ